MSGSAFSFSSAGYSVGGLSSLATVNNNPSTVSLQLNSCGLLLSYLTAGAETSFWRFSFSPYSNFAMQSYVFVPTSGTTGFGDVVTWKFPQQGELAYFTYLVAQLPGIRACPASQGGCSASQSFPYAIDSNNPCAAADYDYFQTQSGGVQSWLLSNYASCGDFVSDTNCGAATCGAPGDTCDVDPWVSYANGIGQVLVTNAELMLGQSTVIDRQTMDSMNFWEELAGKPGKRLTEMIGKAYCREQLVADSSMARTLYVPLPFFYTLAPGMALPMVSTPFACPQIRITLAPLTACVIVSGPNVVPVKCDGTGPLSSRDIIVALDLTLIYMDLTERDAYIGQGFDQLIVQTSIGFTPSVGASAIKINLTAQNPVIEMIWAIRRNCASAVNSWFNYSGIAGLEPLVSAQIDFNNSSRVSNRAASWFRLVQPYQYHSLIPESFIYNYSFSLYPEESQPSGAAGLQRLSEADLLLFLQQGLQTQPVTVILVLRTYNVIKYRVGSGSMTFAYNQS